MSFHGRVGEAWADWLAGWQRVYPPFVPGDDFVQEPVRCAERPPEGVRCPATGAGHDGCECVILRGNGHRRHRALCGAVWEAGQGRGNSS